jgi:hypothetical protein
MKTDAALWQAINAYDIDAADAALPFSRRLARDNGWSTDFARRAIAEYKRFIYLACVSGRTVTPSEEVDSVWHLHLIYTRDYWNRFCAALLKRPIHHGPTEGGKAEADRYRDCYRETLDLYRIEFGTAPPDDMWPDEAIRFAPRTTRAVDSRTHLVLPKRQMLLYAIVATALTLAACSPDALVKDAVPTVLALVLIWLAAVVVGSFTSGAKRTKGRGDRSGSGCGGGCGSGGSSSGGSDSGDSGSGCGSSCGGGCGGGD